MLPAGRIIAGTSEQGYGTRISDEIVDDMFSRFLLPLEPRRHAAAARPRLASLWISVLRLHLKAYATSGTLPIGLVASSRSTRSTLRPSVSEIASSISRFKYAMLFGKIATSSHPSSPASLSTSTSAVFGDNWLSAIFRYSQFLISSPWTAPA